jgi:release factor glutamine methyltransferase
LRVRELLRREKEMARTDLVSIMAFVLRTTPERIYTDPGEELTAAALKQIDQHIAERKKGRPLAYITQKREFFSEELFVDERVLVPRPETELLVEEALRVIAQRRSLESGHEPTLRILDMGTGSGAIGITLARHGAGKVFCVDLSLDALLVARYNAIRIGVSARITFVRSDLFAGLKNEARFDIIAANLPYVAVSEWEGLMAEVKYEPKGALLGGPLGTEVYERFVAGLPGRLNEDGIVLCELGGRTQIEAVGDLMKECGLQVHSKKDLAGQDRMLIGSWKNLL